MNKLYSVEEYKVQDDSRISGRLGDKWAYLLKNQNGETIKFKTSRTSSGSLSEVVLPKLCEELKQPSAKQNLAHIKFENGGEPYHMYGITSVNFLQPRDQIKQLNSRFNIDPSRTYYYEILKLYFSKSFDFHALNLRAFFQNRLSKETEDFKKQFVNHWLTSTYLGCLDKLYGQNSSSILRGKSNKKTHIIAPHYDHDFNMIITEPIDLINRMEITREELQNGIYPRNLTFLKKNYPEELNRFFDLLAKLKNNPRLVDICDVTGLEDFYTKQNNETEKVTIQQAKDKLSFLSENALKGCKSRVDLLTSAR